MSTFAEVILDQAIDKPLDYNIPEPLLVAVKPGMRVLVPVKGGVRKGTVLSLKNTSAFANVKPIAEMLSEKPLISPDLFALASWMAKYYCVPLRKVLKSVLPPSIRGDVKHKKQLFVKSLYSRNELVELCETLRLKHASQAEVLDVMLKHPKGVLLSQLLEEAKVSRAPLTTLIKKNILSCQEIAIDRAFLIEQEFFKTHAKTLMAEQQEALAKIQKSLDENRFETHLLFGVTGSGKTEVYLQAIEHALARNQGAILLVPEIALTAQTIERLRGRFSEKVAILHHRLSPGERHDTWHQIETGQALLVVGARSAIFSPVANLGLIIVDEEHEPSYKQSDESPCYHARDVAVVRAKFKGATVVLGSATPSLESYHNTITGKYTLSKLSIRANNAEMATTQLVDMKHEFEKAKGFTLFSDPLLTAIKKRIKQGEQSLLFLNRRGYHTAQMCTACGHKIQCPHCDIALTYHLSTELLACHLCDYRIPSPKNCPSCHDANGMKFKGVGTELVERSLHAIFPDVRTLRLDADTTRHKGSHDQLFKQFRSGKADVLIGTQMISKGLHFPSVTLVGVLNADSSLNVPDFRASEYAFQLLTQVSGRSGRGALAGEVIIQTHLPEHPAIQLAKAQDYEGFYAQEIAIRKLFNYPPFTHLIKITFAGLSAEHTLQTANTFRNTLISKLPPLFEIHPTIPCGHAKVKDHYRFQILIKGEKTSLMTAALADLRDTFPLGKDLRLSIDVDPLSTYF